LSPAEAAVSEVMIALTEDVIDQTAVTYQTADADDINTIKTGASLSVIDRKRLPLRFFC